MGEEGKLPPVVNPLFMIKAAHWADSTKGRREREGEKNGTARSAERGTSDAEMAFTRRGFDWNLCGERGSPQVSLIRRQLRFW